MSILITEHMFTEKVNPENCDIVLKLSRSDFNATFPKANDEKNYYNKVMKYCKVAQQNHYGVFRKYQQSQATSQGRATTTEFGLQKLGRELRAFLTIGVYKDYDIKNCHFTLLLELCYKHEIDATLLADYCKSGQDGEPDGRQTFLDNNGVDKHQMLRLLNIDNCKSIQEYSLGVQKFYTELEYIKKKLFGIYKDKVKGWEKEKAYNRVSRCMSRLIGEQEHLKIQEAINLLDTNQVGVLMFDGFMTTEDVDLEKLNSETTGIHEFVEKPITVNVAIPISDSTLAEDEEDTPYEKAVKLLSDYCEQENLRFGKDAVYQLKHAPMYYERKTFSVLDCNPVEEIVKMAFKHCDQRFRKVTTKILSQQHHVTNLMYATRMEALGFKQMNYNRHIVSYKNGYLDLNKFEFCLYDDSTPDYCSKLHFDVDFDVNDLMKEWTTIKCPAFDKIWNYQIDDPLALRVAYGLLGQLHFSKSDNKWDVSLYILGTSNTGKSTLVTAIESFFPAEKIGKPDYRQPTFGLQSLLDKFVCIDPDAPRDAVRKIGKTDFQKLLSNETIAVPRKYSSNVDTKIDIHLLVVSNYGQDVPETGEIFRRFRTVNFRPVENKDTSLVEQITQERPLIFLKTILAYKELKRVYANKAVADWDIAYFSNQEEGRMFDNNVIYKFVSSCSDIEYPASDTDFMSWSDFELLFKEKHRGYKLVTSDQSFAQLKLKVDCGQKCKSCLKPHKKGCCANYSRLNRTPKRVIYGLKIKEQQPQPFLIDDGDTL